MAAELPQRQENGWRIRLTNGPHVRLSVFLQVYKGRSHLEPNQSLPLLILILVKGSIFISIIKYPDLCLSLLVAPSTRRNLDNTLNHRPNTGTLHLVAGISRSQTSFGFSITLRKSIGSIPDQSRNSTVHLSISTELWLVNSLLLPLLALILLLRLNLFVWH